MTDQPTDPRPSPRDRDNAARRQAIAERQQAEYDRVLRWARGAFGPAWLPSGRHYLVDKQEEERSRREGTPASAAATVYAVRHEQTGATRHFVVDADGKVEEVAGYEEGFGPMLLEPHPTRTFEHRGQLCRPHRYSLCWAAIETYQPRSAEQLARQRQTREQNKAARQEQAWRDSAPLFTSWAERQEQQEQQEQEEQQQGGHAGP